MNISEGEILRQYVDNQRESKMSLAKKLDITRATLYQYFQSAVLTHEVKEKLKKVFKEDIFTNESRQNYAAPTKQETNITILIQNNSKLSEAHLIHAKTIQELVSIIANSQQLAKDRIVPPHPGTNVEPGNAFQRVRPASDKKKKADIQ